MSKTEYEHLLSNFEYLKFKAIPLHLNETIDFINSNELSFIQGLIKLTDCGSLRNTRAKSNTCFIVIIRYYTTRATRNTRATKKDFS